MRSPHVYGLAAAAIAAAASGFELIRVVVSHGDVAGWLPLGIITSAALFIGVLAVAAIGLALHKSWGFVMGVLGIVVALGYGAILLAASGPNVGLAYVVVGVALFVCLAKSLPHYRTGPATV